MLLGPKRNVVLDLAEVHRDGSDSYGDPDYVAIFGLTPAEWYARGIRLLGRTVVECTRDVLADAIGQDVAAAVSAVPTTPRLRVVDPFAGSGNTLYWMLRHLPRARGLGFEVDPEVFRLTRRNLSILELPIEILHTDYVSGLRTLSLAPDERVLAFVAPPWGNALSASDGLDLRLTQPPLTEIVDLFARQIPNPLLFAIQVYEKIVPAALADVTHAFDWSALRVYGFNAAGQNHGLLLMTRGWRPSDAGVSAGQA